MKRNLFFIIMALLPLVASAYDAEIDGIYYNFSGDEAEVTSGWYFETVAIPESVIYDGTTYTVTSIGKNAFYGSLSLTSVTIPNSVTSIGDYAFYDCRHLPFISIPNSVVTIGSDAFNCCYELTSITIPNSVISIGKRAFASCKELTSIIIPDGVTSIEENTFNGCRALTSVIIPENVTSIDYGAFYNCQALISVTIPDCVITIANDAFFNCRSLNSVNIPNNVTTIGNSAFYNCVGLTFLSIGKSVTNIGRNAFKNCVNLTDVYCYAEEVPKTEGTVFTFNDDAPIASATLHVPAGSLEKYKVTAPWNEFGNIVALSIEINETNFPDENFRNFLLSYYDYPKDGVLTEAEIAIIKIINVYGKGIKSLKGIEYLTAVSDLECVNNQLTELDVSKNTALGYLECSGNPLTSLNVSGCTALGDLICTGTPLTKLDVSGCPKLEYLSCPNNQITTLNVSKNTALTSLKCSGNQLTVLDVSGCTALGDLYCDGNQLTSLDLSKNTKLYALACYNNQLTTLDVSQNTKLQWVAFHQNQIKGAAMDAFLESLPTVDNRTMNVIHNVNEHNVMTKSQVAAARAKHWEPLYYDGSSWQKYEGSEPIEPVIFTKDQMATIILPTALDASKGKYYRLDRSEDGKIIFEEEKQPQAHIPYIIVPSEDFSIETSTLDLAGLSPDTVSIKGIDFIGTYTGKVLPSLGGDGGGSYYDIIDTTPDCLAEEGKAYTIGALRAYLTVNWDDPINHSGSKGPGEKMGIVLKDYGTSIGLTPTLSKGEGVIYDLQGRRLSGKPARGIYIEDGKKKVK